MPRKLRLEYPGACYHVINRGNYRTHLFQTEGAKAAFEACVFEACVKSQWLLHAFVIMGNHYHLALETPEGNLVAGMQWLQATFANRFNKLRGERGHLFQGRYKSLLVEEGDPLGQVCHYLHLNPVRAGMLSVERLREHRYSSYWYLGEKKKRPAFLRVATALEHAGLADHRAGWEKYADYLAWQAAEGPLGRNKAYVSLSRGWALGTAEFKTALVRDHDLAATARAWEVLGADEIRESHCRDALAQAMRILRKTDADAQTDRKSARWKVAIAAHLKRTTQASNGWLARHLNMGGAVAVSQYVSQIRNGGEAGPESAEYLIERLKT